VPMRSLNAAGTGKAIRVLQLRGGRAHRRQVRSIEVKPPQKTRSSNRRVKPAANHPWRRYDQTMRLQAARAQRTKSLIS
jgi:hypothetical protein